MTRKATATARQAIYTQAYGNHVLAIAQAGEESYPYDVGLPYDENLRQAAVQYADQWGWPGDLVGNGAPEGGMIWVFLPEDDA